MHPMLSVGLCPRRFESYRFRLAFVEFRPPLGIELAVVTPLFRAGAWISVPGGLPTMCATYLSL